ncbi:MAG: GAF domain-containing sensor histidine kinase [Candidatus Pedobacter colombiensis]|uniref:histidine kinase n=1 Tax=Candidatus Pedobacter colombiensis TaxID=3121371 RepID=A0AAJ6B4X9_9SPHI|nr:GAF domain-containing sensor histidine kinase [Pedobacter sp.]WEK17610.1 MAG: GAF domain-containing sensor histidine kinase [Pedobacter sp.]
MATQTDPELISVEEERIKALYRYDILDTPPDSTFDKLTKLAAKLIKVPVAVISFVDEHRVWFKSKYGLDVQQMDREEGLCATVVSADDFYLVENAATDPRTLSHKLVTGSFGLRFYAGYQLKTKEGFNLGSFCIIDKVPRTISDDEQEILRDLRDIVMDQIELKFASRLSLTQHNQLLNTTAHDLKNPLTTIPVRADLIKLKKHDPVVVDAMCDQIKIASLNMVSIIDELLQSGSMEAGEMRLLLIKLNVSYLVSNVVAMNQPLAERKGQTIHFTPEMDIYINADEGKLNEVVDNLINNAIKYAPLNTNIYVRVSTSNSRAVIEIEDEGPGLTADDKRRLFQRFTRLSAQPTAGEHSTGLGLSIVKVLVEAHGGWIFAESGGEHKGAKFTVQLPGVK